jgi:CHASE3 domain sensor protein
MPKLMIFNRLSIFQRIAGGFAVVLLLCSVLAFASLQGMHVIDRNVANSRATSTVALAAEGFASSLIELNYKVTRYALTGTTDDRETARQQLATVNEALGKVASTAGQDKPAVAKLGDAFGQYQATTEETFKAVSARFAAAEDLKKTSIALGNMCSAINARLVKDKLDEALPIGLRLQESMQDRKSVV